MHYKTLIRIGLISLISIVLVPTPTSAQTAANGYCRSGKDVIVDVPWPGQAGQIKPATDGFGLQTVAFRLHIPADIPTSLLRQSVSDTRNVGFVHIVEVPGNQVIDHMMSVSKIPCDYNHSPLMLDIGDTAPGLNFGVSNTLPTNDSSGFTNFRPGDTIYINVSHDLTGYGTVQSPTNPQLNPTDRKTCLPDANGSSNCDILFDYAIPGRGAGYPDVQPDGSPWPQDPANPGWPIFSTAYDAAHPLRVCRIFYGVSGGIASLGTSNAPQYQKADGTVFSATCPGDSAIFAVIAAQGAGTTGGTISSTVTSGVPSGLTTLTASNSAEATAIIQALARRAANNNVVVTVTSSGVSTTINGVTFTAPTVVELAAQYYKYLQSGASGNTSPSVTQGGTLATSLTVNLAPGDYNPADQVRLLQAFLNSEVAANLTLSGFFGDQTQVAVIALQNKYASLTYKKAGLDAATGFVGQYTRDLINSKLGAQP